MSLVVFFFQAEDGIRDAQESRGLGDVYKRQLNSMAIATLMTHGPFIDLTDADNWHAILQGITANLAPYNVIYVTMDDACRYARAITTSDIASSSFQPLTGDMSLVLAGTTDVPTMFYLFTESAGAIQSAMVEVPPFEGTTQVSVSLGPATGHYLFLPVVIK